MKKVGSGTYKNPVLAKHHDRRKEGITIHGPIKPSFPASAFGTQAWALNDVKVGQGDNFVCAWCEYIMYITSNVASL
jgi:hypothetical protein